MTQKQICNCDEGFNLGGAHDLANSLTNPLDDKADNAQVVQHSNQRGNKDDVAQGLDNEDVNIVAPQIAKDELQAVSTAVQQSRNTIGQSLQSFGTQRNLYDDECDDKFCNQSLHNRHPGNTILVPG